MIKFTLQIYVGFCVEINMNLISDAEKLKHEYENAYEELKTEEKALEKLVQDNQQIFEVIL